MRICDKCIHDKVCLLTKSRAKCELFDEYRPHGEWEACLDTEYCKCSYCGTVVMLEESVRFHFCPNCGADMRKEGEESAKDPDNR